MPYFNLYSFSAHLDLVKKASYPLFQNPSLPYEQLLKSRPQRYTQQLQTDSLSFNPALIITMSVVFSSMLTLHDLIMF
jgi:hypothetical protein